MNSVLFWMGFVVSLIVMALGYRYLVRMLQPNFLLYVTMTSIGTALAFGGMYPLMMVVTGRPTLWYVLGTVFLFGSGVALLIVTIVLAGLDAKRRGVDRNLFQ